MAEKLTMRERIELELVAIFEDITDVVAVHRQDWLHDSVEHLHGYIWLGGDEAVEGGMGDDLSTTDVEMHAYMAVCIAQPESDTEAPSKVFNRWVGRMEEAFLSDPDLVETGTNQPLSNSGAGIRKVGINDPPVVTNQGEFFAELELVIPYTHYRNDPYAGPGVTERSV